MTETRSQVRVRIIQDQDFLGPPSEYFPVATRPLGSGAPEPAASHPVRRSLLPHACGSEHGYSEVVTGLRHPIGSRAVVDGSTGGAVPTLMRPAPKPSYLPPGWREINPSADDPMSAAPLAARPGAYFPLAIAHFYANSAGDRLQVITSSADATLPGARSVGHVSVNGYAADQTVSGGVRCVTWQVATDNGRQVCSLPKTGDAALSSNELTKVARSVNE